MRVLAPVHLQARAIRFLLWQFVRRNPLPYPGRLPRKPFWAQQPAPGEWVGFSLARPVARRTFGRSLQAGGGATTVRKNEGR